jgi:hypothetical protein
MNLAAAMRWLRSEQFTVHGPALAASMIIAELFYKFHSFTLECLAFLGTWYVLHLPIAALRRFLQSSMAQQRRA